MPENCYGCGKPFAKAQTRWAAAIAEPVSNLSLIGVNGASPIAGKDYYWRLVCTACFWKDGRSPNYDVKARRGKKLLGEIR